MKNHLPVLSLKNLTGAFIVLVFGFSVSLLAFLGEQIVSMPERLRQRLERPRNKIVAKSNEIAKKEMANVQWDVENTKDIGIVSNRQNF